LKINLISRYNVQSIFLFYTTLTTVFRLWPSANVRRNDTTHFRRRKWKRLYIQKRTPVAHRYASSRRDYSYRGRGKRNWKERKRGEARVEVVNVEEESSRICLLVAERKIARFSGAAP